MDGPTGRYHRLAISDDDVSGFVGTPHQVEHDGVTLQVEVHVDFGPALMSVGRHGVPDTPLGQLGKAHDQLATVYTLWVNVLVDGALVGLWLSPQMHRFGRIKPGMLSRIACVSRQTDQVEPGWIIRVQRRELDGLATATDIQYLFIGHGILFAINADVALAADVERPNFAALGKVFSRQLRAGLK